MNKTCPICKSALYKEAIDTQQTNEIGEGLYEICWVCPNGCDGYNSESIREAIISYRYWLKEQIKKELEDYNESDGEYAGCNDAICRGLRIVLSLLEEI